MIITSDATATIILDVMLIFFIYSAPKYSGNSGSRNICKKRTIGYNLIYLALAVLPFAFAVESETAGLFVPVLK
jgi:hypothetical protein